MKVSDTVDNSEKEGAKMVTPLLTRKQATDLLTARYYEQVAKYPRTAELGLELYLRRNVSTLIRNRREALRQNDTKDE